MRLNKWERERIELLTKMCRLLHVYLLTGNKSCGITMSCTLVCKEDEAVS